MTAEQTRRVLEMSRRTKNLKVIARATNLTEVEVRRILSSKKKIISKETKERRKTLVDRPQKGLDFYFRRPKKDS